MNEIIEMADCLTNLLEKQANIELNFCVDVSIMLERLSWDVYRLTNELREINEYKGI